MSHPNEHLSDSDAPAHPAGSPPESSSSTDDHTSDSKVAETSGSSVATAQNADAVVEEKLEALEQLLHEIRNDLPTVRELHTRLTEANRIIEGVSVLPLFRDLILMRDRFEKVNAEDAVAVAQSTVEELDEIMARQGVDRMPFTPRPFDPALQESIGRRKSDAPSGTVIELVRDGFLFEKRVVRAQQVVVAE